MNEDLAKQRFFVLQAVRIGGALLALFGLLVISGKTDLLPPWVGAVLFALGMFDMFFVPKLLAGRWKSPPQ
jgi:hypothetical protein